MEAGRVTPAELGEIKQRWLVCMPSPVDWQEHHNIVALADIVALLDEVQTLQQARWEASRFYDELGEPTFENAIAEIGRLQAVDAAAAQ